MKIPVLQRGFFVNPHKQNIDYYIFIDYTKNSFRF